MSKIYMKHEVHTLAELNALALDNAGKEIDAYVFAPSGEAAYWYPEGSQGDGEWSYEDGYGGDYIRFPLTEGQTITVLVGMEVEEAQKALVREALREELDERDRLAEEAQREREVINRAIQDRADKYADSLTRRGFTTRPIS